MTTSFVGIEASEREIKSMISILENVGKVLEPLDLKGSLNGLPDEVISNKEKITRFLLLVAFMDQQAESPTARGTAVSIYNTFGDDLFFKPQSVLLRIDELVPLKGGYKISPAIGRVLPRFGRMMLRVGGFLIYEMMSGDKRLSEELGRCETPTDAISFLYSTPLVESPLRQKAARMYISWVGHVERVLKIRNGIYNDSCFLTI